MHYERIGADGPFTHKQWWRLLRDLHTHYDGMTLSQGKLATVLQDVAAGKMFFMKTQDNGLERNKIWIEGDNGERRFVNLVVSSESGDQGPFARPAVALKSDSVCREEDLVR